MRIAFVSQPWNTLRPPAQAGSLAIWTYQVARRLAARAEVIVYSAVGKRGEAEEQMSEGVRYRWVPVGFDRQGAALLRTFSRVGLATRPYFWSNSFYARYWRHIAADLSRLRPNAIHLFNFAPVAAKMRQACPDAHIVLNMTGEWLSQLDHGMIDAQLKSVDLLIGCSNYITNQFVASFPSIRGRTVYNGVDVGQFHPGSDLSLRDDRSVSILFVGRIAPEKGIHIACEAFNLLAAEHPQVRLNFVGQAGTRASADFIFDLSRDPVVRDLGRFSARHYVAQCTAKVDAIARKRISFAGPVAHADLPGRYVAADILVNPSFSESFGMSLIEAMACSRPVVATRVGGMPEVVVDGQTGILVERGDAAALANALRRLITRPEECASLGAAGRRRAVERFAWERIADELFDCYQELEPRRG